MYRVPTLERRLNHVMPLFAYLDETFTPKKLEYIMHYAKPFFVTSA